MKNPAIKFFQTAFHATVLTSLLFTSSFSVADTTWIGDVDNNWDTEDNWSHGVPTTTDIAIFGDGSTVTLPSATNVEIKGLLFTSAATQDITLSRVTGADLSFMSTGNAVVVEEGSGSHTINPGGSIRFNGSVDYYIRNNSTNSTLTFIGTLDRHGASGTPRIHFSGSGDIVWNGTFNAALHIYLDADMTGRLIYAAGKVLAINNDVTIDGGTLVLDGNIRNRQSGRLVVNSGGTLTGTGIVGTDNVGNHSRHILINGGTVNPGRVGETGTLTFRNNPVEFDAGSKLVIDLLSHDDHDVLLFDKVGDGELNILPIVTLTETTLQLNLLNGFNAEIGDEFTILTGYDELIGTFEDLADNDYITVGGYTFRISYNDHSTVLQLTAIPEVETAALLLGVVGVLAVLRSTRSRKTKQL